MKLHRVLGMAMAFFIAVSAVPAEVQAAGTCDGISCNGYTDPSTVHDHEVNLNDGETIADGTFLKEVNSSQGNSVKIQGGIFRAPISLHGYSEITEGTFLGGVVSDGNIRITGGSFLFAGLNGDAMIEGGVFESGVVSSYTDNCTITGGIFKGLVSGVRSIQGGTFLGTVQDAYGGTFTFPADTHTVTLTDRSGNTSVQKIIGNGSCAYNPTGGTWWEESGVMYDFSQKVTRDLTLTEMDPASGAATGAGVAESASEERSASAKTAQEQDAEAEEQTETVPSHVCQYEWVTVREAGAGTDGEERLLCKLCGSTESVLIIPAASYQTSRLYEILRSAGEQETVTYDLGNFHTISDKLFATLLNCSDVTLILTYTYQGRSYETTFPAGADYAELLGDGDSFYGLLGLNGRCGIVTREVV